MHSGEKAFYEALSDEEVLTASLSHPEAYQVIMDRYYTAFLRRARSILKDVRDAEDAVAETFTKLYFYAPQFKVVSGASFASWAYTILTRSCISTLRRKARRARREFALDPELLEFVDEHALECSRLEELRESVLSLIARLPQHIARVLKLVYFEDRSEREVAALEGISLAAAKARVHRARQAFRTLAGQLNVTLYE